MSTLWTPDGERPIRRPSEAPPAAGDPAPPGGPRSPAGRDPGGPPEEFEPDDAEMAAQLEELTQQLVAAPAEAIVANHAYGLFQLAAVHLSQQPPNLAQGRLAIDALGALVEGLSGRLGEMEPQLSEGLAQLRMAFVQITRAAEAGPER